MEIWRIQALCRHSSDAIKAYLDNAVHHDLGNIAQAAAAGRCLHAVRSELRSLVSTINAGKAS